MKKIFIFITVFAIILFLPYYTNLTTQVSGLSLLTTASTRPFAFILIWGLFVVITGAFIIRISCIVLWKKQINRKIMSLVLGITLTPLILWMALSWGFPLIQSGVNGTLISFLSNDGFPISFSKDYSYVRTQMRMNTFAVVIIKHFMN